MRFTNFARLAFLLLGLGVMPLALSGCNLDCLLSSNGSATTTGGNDTPGSLTTFNITDYMYVPSEDLWFLDADRIQLQTYFANSLSALGWRSTFYQSGLLKGQWTAVDPTKQTFLSTSTNLLYFSSHGGIQSDGKAHLCLRGCQFDATSGGDNSISTADIPGSWNGPNWLALDACSALVQNVGWEPTFGGNLHGIVGTYAGTNGLSSAALTELVAQINDYDAFPDAWQQAKSIDQDNWSEMVPNGNLSDVLEATGGTHFGNNHDTAPVFHFCCTPDPTVTSGVVQKSTTALSTAYQLRSETMNEAAYLAQYANPAPIQAVNSNLHRVRTSQVNVNHYLTSGAVTYSTRHLFFPALFSAASALSYAKTWIASNGGLPGDAVLVLAGDNNLRPAQSDGGTEAYSFQWRHGSSMVLGADRISITVQDDGYYDYVCTRPGAPCQMVWQSMYEIGSYYRAWRTPVNAYGVRRAQSYTPAQSTGPTAFGYCSAPIDSLSNVANPCDIYPTAASPNYQYVGATTGQVTATSYKL